MVQRLAQRPKRTPPPSAVQIQPAIPAQPAAAARHMSEQHTDALAATSGVFQEIAPKAAQRLTLSICPPYNSRPLECETSGFL